MCKTPTAASAVFPHSPRQEAVTREVTAELEREWDWDGPIVTTAEPLGDFYPAEAYHQEFFRRNPFQSYCQVVVAPKVSRFRKQYVGRLKK